MQFTLFGILWIFVMVVVFAMDTKTVIKVVFFSGILGAETVCWTGGFMGESVVTPLMLSCFVYLFRFFLTHMNNLRIRVPSFVRVLFLFLLVGLGISLFSSVAFRGVGYSRAEFIDTVNYYDGTVNYWSMFPLLIYALTGLCMYNDVRLNEAEIDRLLRGCLWFVAAVGIWQYLTVLRLIPRIPLVERLIYSSAESETAMNNIAFYDYIRHNTGSMLIRFYSCFQEPSYCAGFLSMVFFYYISKKGMTQRDKSALAACLLMIVLTFSATAYATVAFAAILVLVSTSKKKFLKRIVQRGVVLLLVAVVVITVADLWDTFEIAIINKMESGSARTRGRWNQNCIDAFIATYGVGLGMYVMRGSSLFYTLISTVGALGSVSYAAFVRSVLVYPKRAGYDRTLSFMFLVVTVSQLVAIGILSYPVMWIMYFLLCTGYSCVRPQIEPVERTERYTAEPQVLNR